MPIYVSERLNFQVQFPGFASPFTVAIGGNQGEVNGHSMDTAATQADADSVAAKLLSLYYGLTEAEQAVFSSILELVHEY